MAESHSKDGGKKSSKKLILFIALGLLLLGGGAGGYFFFMNKQADSAEQNGHGKKVSDKKHATEEHKEEEHPEAVVPEVYYELPSPLLVNFPPGASAKVIKVSLTILMKDEASIDVLKKHEPMIRNNLLMAISSMGAERVKTTEGKQALRAMMLSEIGSVLEKMSGKNTAKDVYFTEFVMQ